MSTQIYMAKCQPTVATTQTEDHQNDDGQQTTAAPETQGTLRKGFKDLTIIQTNSMFGMEEETKLTSEYAPPQRKKKQKAKGKFDKYALLVRRVIERRQDRDILLRTELCIQSKTLCDTIRDIVGPTYDSIDIKSTPITIPAPFYELFFKKREIEAYLNNKSHGEELRAEVKLVHDFMEADKLTISNLDDHTALVEQGKITFGAMWTLFPPNELLIQNDGSVPECWVCRDVTVAQDAFGAASGWNVSGVRLDFDGHEVGWTKQIHHIPFIARVDGTMEIAQLPLVPAKYFEGWEKVEQELVKRGNKFREFMGSNLHGFAYRHYNGALWTFSGFHTAPKLKINQRVMVDYEAYLKAYPERACKLERDGRAKKRKNRHSNKHVAPSSSNSDSDSDTDSSSSVDSDNESVTDDEDAGTARSTDNHENDPFARLLDETSERYGIKKCMDALLVLSPSRMPGYCLKNKDWGWMLIDGMKPVKPTDAAFNSLQVDATTKALVMSLVRGHRGGKDDKFDDLVSGKGKGLVMLLNGRPGIGKTLTAESIAELTGSPLYNLSGGELSVNVSKVESRLQAVFGLAKRWGAIVLLDEADVVMSRRTSSELERNAIVAVWLRMLEYFEGILFLTTNRAEELDEAFQSRIHLTVNLPSLNPDQRAEVWRSLIMKNTHCLSTSMLRPELLTALGKLDVNGRRIKNLLRTAMYHARSGNKPLDICHLRDVIKVELVAEGNLHAVSQELEGLILVSRRSYQDSS